MGLQTHISRRGAVYYFRLRVPADLVQVIGRKELRRTLGATGPEDARPRGARLLAAARRLFTALRSDPMRPRHEIEEMVRSFYRLRLDEEFGTWLGTPKNLDEMMNRLNPLDSPQSWRLEHQIDIAARDPTSARPFLGELKKRFGFAPEPGSPEEGLAVTLLMRALVELTYAEEARLEGQPYYVAKDPLFADIGPAPAPPPRPAAVTAPAPSPFAGLAQGAERPVTAHLADFLRDKARTIKNKKTLGDYERSVASLEAVVGRKAIAAITELDIAAYRRAMLEAPARFEDRFRTADPRAAADLNNQRKQPFPRFADSTLENKYFTNIRTFFDWAKENKLVHENPAKKLRAPRAPKGKRKDPSKQRHPFTLNELRRIFEAEELFGPQGSRDHLFWAPLLTLMSGIRPNEIGLLELPDVANHWGWPHLNVTTQSDIDPDEEPDDEEYDPRADDEKPVKTQAGKRLVPVHPELVRIGFMDYVDDMRRRQAGATKKRLFPDMQPDTYGYHSSALRWFNRTFLTRLKIKRRRNSFYSLRHSAEDAFDASGISAKTRDRIMGHKHDDMPSRYGGGRLIEAQSKEYRDKFRYDGLSLAHIQYRPAAEGPRERRKARRLYGDGSASRSDRAGPASRENS